MIAMDSLLCHDWSSTLYNVLPGREKSGLFIFPQLQNNCLKISVHRKPCFIAWRTSWEVWNPAGTALCALLTVHSSAHIFTSLICGKSYIHILRNNSSVHSVAVTRSCDTLVLTASSSSSAASSLYFNLPWQRVCWPFFRMPLCLFLVRSLGFLDVFQFSLWASLASVNTSLASRMAITRTIGSEWIWFGQSPWPCVVCPLGSLFRMVHIDCTLCIYCILHSPWVNSILFFVHSNIPFNCLICRLIADSQQHCSIIVRLLFVILILEMFSKYSSTHNQQPSTGQ
jgi:hypothetical protein